ncbi:hypothetical protein FKM82_009688 [Ascaphus truei]
MTVIRGYNNSRTRNAGTSIDHTVQDQEQTPNPQLHLLNWLACCCKTQSDLYHAHESHVVETVPPPPPNRIPRGWSKHTCVIVC